MRHGLTISGWAFPADTLAFDWVLSGQDWQWTHKAAWEFWGFDGTREKARPNFDMPDLGAAYDLAIGWSLGGILLLHAIAESRIRPKTVVLISSTARFCQAKDFPAGIPEAEVIALERVLIRNPESTLEGFYRRCFAPSAFPLGMIRQYIAQAIPTRIPALRQGLRYLREVDLRSSIGRCACPTLVLHATLDSVIPLAASEALSYLLPQAQLAVLEGGTHALPLTHRVETAQKVQEFIQRAL